MSIEKQGKHFYYNFRLNAKRYHGACKGCSTMRQAETYEKRLKADLKKAAVQEDAIKFHEQEIKKIIGRDDILLVDAIDRAIAEPTARPKTKAQIKFKKSAWYDFCAFCQVVWNIKQKSPRKSGLYFVQWEQFNCPTLAFCNPSELPKNAW